ncbi:MULTISPECIES: DUF4262 domain-containing protein [Aerosakkonema]|uniref:DUF4262 domain-containing protein n=1 Tax=Aerosakkonema TaxID=1246629 RepID=UPI0035BB4A17
MKERKINDPVRKKIVEDVQRVGWHVMAVGADPDKMKPGFAYSIGLWQSFQHPEIIMFGLPYHTMGHIINDIGSYVKGGKPIVTGQPYSDFIQNYSLIFESVASAWCVEYLRFAVWFYGEEDTFSALQCFWPDKAGKFPWDVDFDDKLISCQPLLCG